MPLALTLALPLTLPLALALTLALTLPLPLTLPLALPLTLPLALALRYPCRGKRRLQEAHPAQTAPFLRRCRCDELLVHTQDRVAGSFAQVRSALGLA